MNPYDIAAFIWPSYTGDEPRTRIFWPEGYGEWQTVKSMGDKGYPGCRWPRKPVWGYVNEADRYVMEMQIEAAVSHGVNVFIYDWYWYDDRPFLENCLNDGFLKARNNDKMRFYLMWANHNATHLWDKRNSADLSTVIWNGAVTPEIFDKICDRTIERYFKRDNYYKIDGCPVYMVFDVDNLIRTFGSTTACREGLRRFRRKTQEAGFPGLHLQFVHWDRHHYNWLAEDDAMRGKSNAEIYEFLGVDSVTSYNWGASIRFDGEYTDVTDAYEKSIRATQASISIPFYPNLSIGWDNNVRFQDFVPGVVVNNTPENVEAACRRIKAFADASLQSGRMHAPLITVNSWNEWTETSYLEPDDLYGYGYLEAFRRVFLEEVTE
ncbi:MAG: glycoside hydrolase family 99-like domain-containing protein [Clostridia bacterium]|nr:glycoside hydrolase family 99-like domain-containing protein [Clostridia bacterium]